MTNIILDAPSTGGPPAVKFPTVGSSVVVGIVNVKKYEQTDFDGKPKVDSNGNQLTGKRITAIVVSSEGATVSGSDDVAQPGELVSFFIEGGKFFTYEDALKAYGQTVGPGDVMWWKFDHEEPASRPGYNPRKVYVAKIRRPEAKDGDLADRCVAAYHEQAARPAVDSPSAPLSTAQVAETFGADVEEPF